MNNESYPYMYNSYRNQQDQSESETPPRVFAAAESAFAWLSVLFGYLFCRTVPVIKNPLGGLLFIAALFTSTAVVLFVLKKKISVSAYMIAASALLLSASLIISANGLVATVSYLYSMAAYIYFVYTANGNSIQQPIGELFFFDFIKSAFFMPFVSFGKMFLAMFGKSSRTGKIILKILIGIGLAIIPTLIIRFLLSFDAGFNAILNKIFKISFWDVFSHSVSLQFGIPIGMYIFGLFLSSCDKKAANVMNAEKCRKSSERMKIMSSTSALISVMPIMLLYIIFFISQWKNYFSAFSGVLPSDTIYSTYARSGFFELCGVAVVNLIIILLISLFTKRSGKGIIIRIINSVLSFMTVILICTAMSKMILYIDRFGLTPKRVYASWFIIVLAVIFIFIIIKQIIKHFNFAALTVIACVLLFALLGLSGTDTLIAEYNVDRYISGTLEKIDLDAMSDLGDSAIPALVKYGDTLDPNSEEYKRLLIYLEEYEKGLSDSFFGITVPREKAKKALNSAEWLNKE